jgi:hypothetical protein
MGISAAPDRFTAICRRERSEIAAGRDQRELHASSPYTGRAHPF